MEPEHPAESGSAGRNTALPTEDPSEASSEGSFVCGRSYKTRRGLFGRVSGHYLGRITRQSSPNEQPKTGAPDISGWTLSQQPQFSFSEGFQSDVSHAASVSFGFPSSNKALSLQTKKATTMRNRPDTTMRLSMDTLSANGPKTSIPTGIISVATIV